MNEQDKIEEDAELAAHQFIKSQLKFGAKLDITKVRKKALREQWKPNLEIDIDER